MCERQECGYCRKLVRDKPVLGTLHFCLTPRERTEIDYFRSLAEMQHRALASNYQPYGLLGSF